MEFEQTMTNKASDYCGSLRMVGTLPITVLDNDGQSSFISPIQITENEHGNNHH